MVDRLRMIVVSRSIGAGMELHMDKISFIPFGCAALFPIVAVYSAEKPAVRSEKITIGKADEEKTYHLIQREKTADQKPMGLVVILPGGDGQGESFLPFVENIHRYVLDETWIIALGTAKKWTIDQRIVWPTEKHPVPEMKYATEKYVASVLEDVSKRKRIDPERVIMMGWSSGGPACYAISLSDGKVPKNYYILMSVFKPETLPPLRDLRDTRYVIEHGVNDRVCPVRMAREAAKTLEIAGAEVEYVEHPGEHGFTGGPIYPRMRDAIDWLTQPRPDAVSRPADRSE
jgi:predicted esterase